MSRLFQGGAHAKLYAQYRPTYPTSVLDRIVKFCKQFNNDQDTALDLGCGSGQSTVPLAKYFKEVIGTDASQSQINNAPTGIGNVSFMAAQGEDLSFRQASSVDLITVAQAVHWFDLDKFYPEVERVLKPGGVLSVYGYGNVKVNSSEAQEHVTQFYSSTLDGYWEKGRSHIDAHFRTIKSPPFCDFHRDDSLLMRKVMPLSAFIGYLSSWSAYRTFLSERPDSDALDVISKRLLECYSSTGDSDPEIEASWPLFILMANKKH